MLQTAVILTGLVLLAQPDGGGPRLVGTPLEATAAADYAFGDQAAHSIEASRHQGAPGDARLPHPHGGVLQAMLQQQEEEAPGSGSPFDAITPEPPGAGSQPAQQRPSRQPGSRAATPPPFRGNRSCAGGACHCAAR